MHWSKISFLSHRIKVLTLNKIVDNREVVPIPYIYPKT